MGYQEGRSLAICPWGRAPPRVSQEEDQKAPPPPDQKARPRGEESGLWPQPAGRDPLCPLAQALVHTRGPAADPSPAALTAGAWLSLSKCGPGSKLTSTATQTRGGHWGKGRWVLSTNTHTDTHGTAHARTHARTTTPRACTRKGTTAGQAGRSPALWPGLPGAGLVCKGGRGQAGGRGGAATAWTSPSRWGLRKA